MTIKAVLLKFFLSYFALTVIAGMAISHFGIESNHGVNIGILAGCIFWVCADFGRKNRRYFSSKEKKAVVLGMIAIDLLLQLFGLAIVILAQTTVSNLNVLIFVSVFICAVHAIFIYYMAGLPKKFLLKAGLISS